MKPASTVEAPCTAAPLASRTAARRFGLRGNPAVRSILAAGAALLAFVASAVAQAPTRGLKTDLESTNDRFISLDLNGDGKADMLYSRPGKGYAAAYLSHGDGTFRYVAYAENGTSYGGFMGDLASDKDTFVALDLNGDGKSDFIEYRPGSGYAMKCLSVGDGSVRCAWLSTPSGQSLGMVDEFNSGLERVVALDLNGDGRSDFIVYSPGQGFGRAYLSNPDGTVTPVDYAVNSVQANGFAGDLSSTKDVIIPLDLNGDKKTDFLLVRPGSGYAFECLSIGDGSVRCAALSTPNSGVALGMYDTFLDGRERIVPLDLNNDGLSDFIFYVPGGGWARAYIALPAAACASASCPFVSFRRVDYAVGGSTFNNFKENMLTGNEQIMALDLNGDGKSDFLVYTSGGGNPGTATAYISQEPGADALTAVAYRDSGGSHNGFIDDVAANTDTAVALNFLGQTGGGGLGSGFLWYRPASGVGGIRVYAPTSSNGQVQHYGFAANPATWMADLSWSIANTPLKSIVMPGTHDTAMYQGGGSGDLAITQQQDFQHQLQDGARVFDFRFDYLRSYSGTGNIFLCCVDVNNQGMTQITGSNIQSEDFWMYGHSNYAAQIRTEDALTTIRDYLNANSQEIVVLWAADWINGSALNKTAAFVSLLQRVFPSGGVQLYSPLSACGQINCSLLPQNATPLQLQKSNQRLIIISTTGQLSATGWAWPASNTSDYEGFCNYGSFAGMISDEDELACAEVGTSPASGVQGVRPYFQPAAASQHFLLLNTAITDATGYGSLGPGSYWLLSPYDNATCGDSGAPLPSCPSGGTNVNSYMTQQLNAGKWLANSLNLWLMDGLQPNDPYVRTILGRNDQTWTNAGFFDSNSPQPAGAIGVGANGDVWAAPAPGGGSSIYKYDPNLSKWQALVPSAPNVKKIAVGPTGTVYWLESQGSSQTSPVFSFDGQGTGPAVNGVFQDIAAGPDGSIWGIGPPGSTGAATPQDGGVYVINKGASVPAVFGGDGISIAVDNFGAPWVVNGIGQIWRFNTLLQQWDLLPSLPTTDTNLETGNNTVAGDTPIKLGSLASQATAISVGADGSVIVTATMNGFGTSGLYGIYAYNPRGPSTSMWRWDAGRGNWTPIRMDAQTVAVDPGGHPWVIRPDGTVYKGALDQM